MLTVYSVTLSPEGAIRFVSMSRRVLLFLDVVVVRQVVRGYHGKLLELA